MCVKYISFTDIFDFSLIDIFKLHTVFNINEVMLKLKFYFESLMSLCIDDRDILHAYTKPLGRLARFCIMDTCMVLQKQ